MVVLRAQLAAFALLLALPLVLLLGFQVYRQFEAEQSLAEQVSLRIARASAGDTRSLLDSTERVLNRIASHASGRSGACSLIADLRFALPGYSNLYLLDERGQRLCGELRAAAANAADPGWFEEARRAGKFHLGRVRAGAQPALYASVPAGGGLAVAEIDLADFEPASAERTPREGMVITIIDAAGTVIARSAESARLAGRNFRGQGVIDEILARGSGMVRGKGFLGVERMFAVAPVEGTDWLVAVGMDVADAFAPARASAWRAALLAAVIVLASAWLPGIVGQRILRRALGQRQEHEQRERDLLRQLTSASDDERRHLSRELHDQIGQNLAALRINSDVMRRALGPARPAALDGLIERQDRLVGEVLQAARHLTAELRPVALDRGLLPALRHVAEVTAERFGITVDVLGSEPFAPLKALAGTALVRVAQEAIVNATKHAQAETVTIDVECDALGTTLSITDDGAGYDAARAGTGFGIAMMRERMAEAGGGFEIEGAPGRGTRVRAFIPAAA